MTNQKVILVTGTSSGFGAMTVRALADAKHVVYAGMRDITGSDAEAANLARAYADDHTVTLRPVQMDVTDQALVDGAVRAVLDESGHIDVLIHNAGHIVLGPTEAFTPSRSPRSTTSTSCRHNASTGLFGSRTSGCIAVSGAAKKAARADTSRVVRFP
jgi:NAD(P)-dependent dehydrogenase (short-subunit alcohol dehydrogenase family)